MYQAVMDVIEELNETQFVMTTVYRKWIENNISVLNRMIAENLHRNEVLPLIEKMRNYVVNAQRFLERENASFDELVECYGDLNQIVRQMKSQL